MSVLTFGFLGGGGNNSPITENSVFLGEVADEATMLTLVAETGDYCYRTDEEQYYIYTDPNWGTLDDNTLASTINKGVVQEATQEETNLGTDIGSTGARLFVPPSKLNALFSTNIAGNVLYVNPLNANASDSYTRTQAIGRPEKAFLTLQRAITVAQINVDIIVLTAGQTHTGNVTIPQGANGVSVENKRYKIYAENSAYSGSVSFSGIDNMGVLLDIVGGNWTSASTLFLAPLSSNNEIRITANNLSAPAIQLGGKVGWYDCKTIIATGVGFTSVLKSTSIQNITPFLKAEYISASSMFSVGLGYSAIDILDSVVSCARIVISSTPTGAMTFIDNLFKGCKIILSSTFGDTYTGRIREIRDCDIICTHVSNPAINLIRGNWATDGTGYFLRIYNSRVRVANKATLAISSSDVKSTYIQNLSTNATALSSNVTAINSVLDLDTNFIP